MYRVLLVDDDPHILNTNQIYLVKQGYQVYRVESGPEALELLSTAEVDAVVLDLDMPGMDGVTVCQRLREVSDVPVTFLSAYAQTDDRIRGATTTWPNPTLWWSWSCGCGCTSSGGGTWRPGRFCATVLWKST